MAGQFPQPAGRVGRQPNISDAGDSDLCVGLPPLQAWYESLTVCEERTNAQLSADTKVMLVRS